MPISNLGEGDLENFHLKYWYFSQTEICNKSLIWKISLLGNKISVRLLSNGNFTRFGESYTSSLWDPVDTSLYLASITSRVPFLRLKNVSSVASALLITKAYTLCSQQMKPKICLVYEEQYQQTNEFPLNSYLFTYLMDSRRKDSLRFEKIIRIPFLESSL